MSLQRLVGLLEAKGGYRLVSEPLHVADLEFKFLAVLVGPIPQQHLVVIHDLAQEQIDSVVRRLRAFGLVLQRSSSKRSLTLVLLNAQEVDGKSLESFCRVLRVDLAKPLDRQVAILLPLPVEEPLPQGRAAEEALQKALGSPEPESITARILIATRQGAPNAIRDAVLGYLETIATQVLNDKRSL